MFPKRYIGTFPAPADGRAEELLQRRGYWLGEAGWIDDLGAPVQVAITQKMLGAFVVVTIDVVPRRSNDDGSENSC